MGYDDTNNGFSKNLGIQVFLTIYSTLCTKLIFGGGFFTKFATLAQCASFGFISFYHRQYLHMDKKYFSVYNYAPELLINSKSTYITKQTDRQSHKTFSQLMKLNTHTYDFLFWFVQPNTSAHPNPTSCLKTVFQKTIYDHSSTFG